MEFVEKKGYAGLAYSCVKLLWGNIKLRGGVMNLPLPLMGKRVAGCSLHAWLLSMVKGDRFTLHSLLLAFLFYFIFYVNYYYFFYFF